MTVEALDSLLPRSFLKLKYLCLFIAASLSALSLAACEGPAGASLASQPSQKRVWAHSILGNGQALYVTNEQPATNGTVTVYTNAGLVRTITDGIKGPNSLAITEKGDLYVANFSNSITVYKDKGKTLERTISRNLLHPTRVALDSEQNLYVVRQNRVNIYVHGKSRIMHSLKIQAANAVALDSQGNLYVSTGSANAVDVYAPGSKTPTRTIRQGIDDSGSLAFDSAGNLYVGNGRSRTYCGDITVYAPGSNSILRTISEGVCGPASMAFDTSGNLYVANVVRYGSSGNSVTVYAPGSSSVLRTVTDGLNSPCALAFDKGGNLYVANFTGADVTVYAPGGTTVLHAIHNGISYPNAIVIGS